MSWLSCVNVVSKRLYDNHAVFEQMVFVVEMVKVYVSFVVLFEMAAKEKAGQLIDVALDQ